MSDNPCIVIADRARARLFSVLPGNEDEGRRLTEERILVNPEGTITDMDLFTDRGGRSNRYGVPGGSYGVDDGKDRERHETTRRFAKELARAIALEVKTLKSQSLVLIATPKFLGALRAELPKLLPRGVALTELAEDLSWHAVSNIESVLVKRGILPPRELPAAAYRPRAQLHGPGKARRAAARH